MSSVSVGRRLALLVALLVLAGQAWLSLSGVVARVGEARGLARWLQTGAELAAGLLSVAGLIATIRPGRSGTRVMLAWAVAVPLATGPSSVVWGHATVAVGLLVAGLTLLLALGVVWLWRWALAV